MEQVILKTIFALQSTINLSPEQAFWFVQPGSDLF
jgi:hypothetical protein